MIKTKNPLALALINAKTNANATPLPLVEHLSAVQTLLNYLEKAQIITSELRKKISPKLNKLELG